MKFILKVQKEKTSSISVEFESDYLPEVLEELKSFIQASGFHTGNKDLELVSNESVSIDELYSKEEVKKALLESGVENPERVMAILIGLDE